MLLRPKHFLVVLFSAISFTFFLHLDVFASIDELVHIEAEKLDSTEQLTGKRLQGYALKQPVSVYAKPSKEALILKNYNYNHHLKYRTYSAEWYQATVFLNGIAYRGYIHKDDVGNHDQSPSVKGIALNKLNVYSATNSKSKVWKSYKRGSILKYRSFNEDWHIATVKADGEWQTGYILAKDVETAVSTQDVTEGIGTGKITKVYSSASTDSKVLKSYKEGKLLKFRTFTKGWFEATVYVNGKKHTGYIAAKDVEQIKDEQQTLSGIGIKKPTRVYSQTSKNSKTLKSYKEGKVLKYRTFTKEWFEATVYVNGKKHTGYIAAKDVEQIKDNQQTLNGIGIKQPTRVYSSASKSSKTLKSYKAGSILKYRTYTKSWFEATVYVNGKKHTGYIAAKDVEQIKDNQQTLKGIGIKQPTRVYSSASKSSKTLKSYKAGNILKYRTFTKGWFEATVYINGKKQTGYLASTDVEEIKESQETLNGVGIKQPTRVYSLASKESKVLKNYKYGHILKFRTFSNNWYEATVYINGKPQTGYIFKYDIDTNLNTRLKGYALKKSTAVYSDTSRNSSILKSYKKGHLLQYRSHNNNWFRATVYVGGKARTGFIHNSDVSPHAPKLKANALANPTHVYSKATRSSAKLKSYKQGHLLKFRPFNDYWYEATVYIKGKSRTGYIHVNDVGKLPSPPVQKEPPVKENTGFDIPILMYHQVGDNPEPEEYGRFVTEENFKEQMNYLKSSGFTPIHFDELPNVKDIDKPIIVTFDDGYENNMIAYNVLKEIKDNDDSFLPKATFFIIGSKINVEGSLSKEQIKEISDSGIISIQSHTMSHPFFNDAESVEEIDHSKEIHDSKTLLEEITGERVTALAYPYGSYNDFVINEAKKSYDYAVTTKSGIANTNEPYELKRVRVSFDTTLEEFKKSINQ